MTIQIGDRVPNVTIATMAADGPAELTTDEIFTGKKVVLFALPGAYTPTCSKAHLPGYVIHHDAIIAKGVDTIACLSVNDAFVMAAWGATQNVEQHILMLADGSGAFTQALGLELDLHANHMGLRSQRYAMVVDDGVVTHLNVEEGGGFKVSDAVSILNLLGEFQAEGDGDDAADESVDDDEKSTERMIIENEIEDGERVEIESSKIAHGSGSILWVGDDDEYLTIELDEDGGGNEVDEVAPDADSEPSSPGGEKGDVDSGETKFS